MECGRGRCQNGRDFRLKWKWTLGGTWQHCFFYSVPFIALIQGTFSRELGYHILTFVFNSCEPCSCVHDSTNVNLSSFCEQSFFVFVFSPWISNTVTCVSNNCHDGQNFTAPIYFARSICIRESNCHIPWSKSFGSAFMYELSNIDAVH
jgi:hypothetical protein